MYHSDRPKRPALASYEDRRLRLMSEYAIGTEILDVGYSAQPNPYLAHPGRRITGVDIAPSSDDQNYDERHQMNVFDMATQEWMGRYDTIVAGEFIEHVERPYDLCRLFARLLSPGGRLVLSTPNPVGFPTVGLEWLRSKHYYYAEEHTYYFSPRWVERILERSGLYVEAMAAVGFWPTTLPCPIVWSYQVIYVARIRSDAGDR